MSDIFSNHIAWIYIYVVPEGDEAEVEPVEQAPALPLPEQDGPAANVPQHHRQAHRDRHRNLK